MFILQSIILIITIMSIVLFIIEVFKLNKSSRLDAAYASRYKWRILEETHKNNVKTYSLQFKKVLIWWTYDTFLDIETCKEYYKFLQQYEEKLNEIKLNTKILDEKLINIK